MLYIGTSGWQYDDWRGRFYPPALPTARQLEHYAANFQVVELNASFYRLPSESAVDHWREEVPDDFAFAAKASRYLTHIRRLREPAEPLQLFFGRLGKLGAKLGPVLLQLPPNLAADAGLLDDVLAEVPPAARVAVEPRHPSWFTDDIRAVLEHRGAALCVADRRGRLQGPLWATTDWGYIRLHEGLAQPSTCYGEDALRRWPATIAATWPDRDVYVFFNNDHAACAVANAARLATLAREAGISCGRAPSVGRAFRY